MNAWVLGPSAALALAACGPPRGHTTAASAEAPTHRASAERICTYDVTVVRPTAVVDVEAHCEGGRTTGFAGDPRLAPFTSDVRDEHGAPLARRGGGFVLAKDDRAVIRYRVDLDGAAGQLRDFDYALTVGRSLVAPLSSYVLAPEPPSSAGTLFVTVRPGPGADFVTELRNAGAGFSLAERDIGNATYGTFGRFDRGVVALRDAHGAASLDVVSLDGDFALSRDEREAWVRRDADAVARYYGGFPMARAGVVLVPVPAERRVVFGKVLASGGGTIVVLLGAEATRQALDSDWVLVHEMFHLGFPAFVNEGKWLDEGLATYVEPLIRARAGMLTEEEGWAEVVRDMPRGVRLCETTGLEHPHDIRSIYWGGAVVALLADVEARRRTNGARGLEDALRAGLARGWDASHVMRVADAIHALDETFGSPVLAELAAAYSEHGSPVPLERVLAELGVERRDGRVVLHDDAPLAHFRRAITYGADAEKARVSLARSSPKNAAR